MAGQTASALDTRTSSSPSNCDCKARALFHRDIACRDEFAAVTLSLLRLIGAAYATAMLVAGRRPIIWLTTAPAPAQAHCWLLVQRGLARMIRRCRDDDVVYLPSSCNRLSADEAQLMRLIEAARLGDPVELATAVSGLVGTGHESETIRAANALADLSRRPATHTGAAPRRARSRDDGEPQARTPGIDGATGLPGKPVPADFPTGRNPGVPDQT